METLQTARNIIEGEDRNIKISNHEFIRTMRIVFLVSFVHRSQFFEYFKRRELTRII